MSDKTLVKHLQRELARLESELRTPTSALLRQKDLQIAELEKELKDSILQRDIAQSQLKEVLQLLGDDSDSVQQLVQGNYPNLRVRISAESMKSLVTDLCDSPDTEVRLCSAFSSRSLDSRYAQLPNFEEILMGVNTPPRLVIGNSNYSETNSVAGWDESKIQNSGISEDLYKKVHSIEKEDCSSNNSVESSDLYPEKLTSFQRLRGFVMDNKENQRCRLSMTDRDGEIKSTEVNIGKDEVLVSTEQRQERVSTSFGQGKIKSSFIDKEKELRSVHVEDVSSRAKFFSQQNDDSLTNMLNNSSAQQSANVETEADLVPTISEIRENLVREPSPLTFTLDVEIISAGKGTHSLSRSIVDKNSSPDEDAGDIDSCQPMKEKLELHLVKEVANDLGKTDSEQARQSVQGFKDAGLNNIEDEYRSLQSWPAEFKSLQKEIIDLWQSCHVSLLHRKYFFLLFQGDPTDAVYMALELRRLKSLKDTFDRGEKTVIRGKNMSLELSKKVLRQERKMLSKQMLKKLSDEERDMLFLKWGIGVDTQLRRLQLANRLWANTDDMNHIYDNARLVAKLTGFDEKDQAPEETPTPDFHQLTTARSYSLKRDFSSLL